MPSMTTRYAEMFLYNKKPNPKAPPAPKIDGASAQAGGIVLVTFTKEVFDPPVTSYRADGKSSGGQTATASIVSTKPAAIQLTGLTVGEVATITLTAINSVGASAASAPVNVTPIA